MSKLESSAERRTLQPHLLIIDDSPEEQKHLFAVFRSRNFRVSVAFDGYQGYLRAKALRPDLILMDVCMPRTDGFAGSRLLKADSTTRRIPIIFLTSANSDEQRINGLTAGGVDYISKPFNAEEVLLRVRIHIELAHGAQTPSDREEGEMPSQTQLAAAVRYIRENLDTVMTINDLANQVGTYEKKLTKLFREHFGCTVSHFLREERIRRAQHFLLETDMSVQDVAQLVGFQSAANFATAFRERVGMPPLRWRQSAQRGTSTLCG